MMKLIAQILLATMMVASLLMMLHRDVNGRVAEAPRGFRGIVISLLGITVSFAVQWAAGAFSEIIGR